jgi:acyl dehydratase
MKIFQTLAELVPLVGQELVVSDWIIITQDQVNLFAQATGDHQWIHVDEERAKAGPFGAPIAHGFLTLALLPRFFRIVNSYRADPNGRELRAQQSPIYRAGASG